MNLLRIIGLILICGFQFLQGQSNLSLEDIWVSSAYTQKGIKSPCWNSKESTFLFLRDNQIISVDEEGEGSESILFDGNAMNLLISAFSLSPQEDKVLLETDKEKIWRRSFTATYYTYDFDSKALVPLSQGGRQAYAEFSPDGNMVAFVRGNNLFIKDLKSNQELKITNDGKEGEIINGSSDWTYEEEYYMTSAFKWSPEGGQLAYLKFDLTNVPEYQMQMWEGTYPNTVNLKYPKPGEANVKASLWVYRLSNEKTVEVNLGPGEYYVPEFGWTRKTDLLYAVRLNRRQNKFEVLHVGTNSGMSQIVLIDTDPAYIDVNDMSDVYYLEKSSGFIFASEKSGNMHLYQFDVEKRSFSQITRGNFDVSKLVAVDDNEGRIYYLSTEENSKERHLYSVSFKGKKKIKHTIEPGWHDVKIDPNMQYMLDVYSNLKTPKTTRLIDIKKEKEIKVLEDNSGLKALASKMSLSAPEFTEFYTPDSVRIEGYYIKPPNFNETKEYPVLMFVYGGPGNQQVKNSWAFEGRNLWHQYMANQGYLIACFDNRGTGGRGTLFKKTTYRNLGVFETQDQISAAKHLSEKPFVDSKRIGIWGWSYGGYMSASCILKAPDVFKTAVSVAPVTDWKFYNSIYTERYMQRPSDNPDGYEATSLLPLAENMEGNFLLIHGSGDDNVHVQHSLELSKSLINANKPFDFFVYPNAAHSLNLDNSRIHVYEKISTFIKNNL